MTNEAALAARHAGGRSFLPSMYMIFGRWFKWFISRARRGQRSD